MLIDSHCHLNYLKSGEKRLCEAIEGRVEVLIVPAVKGQEWADIASWQAQYPDHVYTAYGLHPIAIKTHQEADLTNLIDWIEKRPRIAIGECGLDGTVGNFERQKYFFKAQIEIAVRYDLPLIIHARSALEIVLQMLKKYHGVRFVIHSFTGSDQQLDLIIKLGGYIGIGGTSTYQRAKRLRTQISRIDPERYILETDAPDQPIDGYQGLENSPDKVRLIAQNLAELRSSTEDEIEWQSTENCKKLFKTHF